MKLRTLMLVLAVSTLGMLAGCSADATEPDDDNATLATGSFSASVSGQITDSFSGGEAAGGGGARFGQETDPLDNSPVWELVLLSAELNRLVRFRIANGSSPAVGTHTITDRSTSGDGDLTAGFFTGDVVTGGFDGLWGSTSGTLTVTEATASSMNGTFQFDADGFDVAQAGSVTVTGSFEAVSRVSP